MAGIVSINSLIGGYENKNIFELLNLDFKKGSFTAIAGPNGSGKSTLLKYLIKELKTSKGHIEINNFDVCNLSQNQLAETLSFVAQNTKNDYEFTVRELVQMGRFCHKDEHSSSQIVDYSLQQVGIQHLQNCLITQISGGELQLAMLARAICQQSDIMVLDEPINNLDPNHEIKLLNLLSDLKNQGKTIICVLHDLNAILNYCDQCIIIKDGTVLAGGKTDNVLTEKNIKEAFGIESEIISLSRDRKLLTFYCNR